MPRITTMTSHGHGLHGSPVASMRPGRNAPDNVQEECEGEGEVGASMRPGRNAPDNFLKEKQLQANNKLQ